MQLSSIGTGAMSAQSNRVLRNTYWLLTLSLVPTVAGAWLGLSTGILQGMSMMMSTIVFMVGAFGLMFLVEKNKETAAGVPILLAFTFFMGLMLSRMLGAVLGLSNGAGLVMTAFAGTAGVFGGMAVLSSVIKRDLAPLGKVLFIGAILTLIAMLANLFIQSSALALTLAVLVAGIFSLFVLVDLKRVRDGHETNYISATMGIYLSLYNVFTSLLQLLGVFGGEE